jgi:hypothetical protein
VFKANSGGFKHPLPKHLQYYPLAIKNRGDVLEEARCLVWNDEHWSRFSLGTPQPCDCSTLWGWFNPPNQKIKEKKRKKERKKEKKRKRKKKK